MRGLCSKIALLDNRLERGEAELACAAHADCHSLYRPTEVIVAVTADIRQTNAPPAPPDANGRPLTAGNDGAIVVDDRGVQTMSAFLVRIEGCNFAATAYDTDDLSTIRGSSLAYLRIAEEWPARLTPLLPNSRIMLLVSGASQGTYLVETTGATTTKDIEKAIANAIGASSAIGDVLDVTRPHLTFTYAATPETGDHRKDVALLVAACHQRQLQQPTVDIPLPSGTGLTCPYDRIRPAVSKHKRQDGTEVQVSASVDARRSYGRTARQAFYKDELESTNDLGFTFVDRFEELVEDNPRPLPPALTGKHAVVYLDGNAFTRTREDVVFAPRQGDTAAAVRGRERAFSDAVKRARRHLLKAMLGLLTSDKHMLLRSQGSASMGRLKFETLLWGGDEALFVLPAWKLMDVLPVIAEALEDQIWQLPFELGTHKLSHAVGIVICNIKTPIAVSRALAQSVADASKPLAKADAGKDIPLEELRNVYSIQILESVEPPRSDLGAFRMDLYGTEKAEAFTFVGRVGVDGLLQLVRQLQADQGGLPRSQLFKLINAARKLKLLEAGRYGDAERFLGQSLDDESKDALGSRAFRRSKCQHYDSLRSPLLGYTTDAPLVPLLHLAELWDYVDPLGQRP